MDVGSATARNVFAHRIVAKMPTIAAAALKLTLAQPFIYPRNDLDFAENFLHMMFATTMRWCASEISVLSW